ncbi:hypothetical protein ACHAW5_004875 [Stephanodiscus triporus]|uniref:Uncharacterized protein n=1 Tax=Stephanodiscus triporus TaxID=2934178 RepID=A0ABD3P4B7_9STRA
MAPTSVDASNACIPPSHPLVRQSLPLPTATRGEPLFLDGDGGRLNEDDVGRRPLLMYGFGRLVVIREVDEVDDDGEEGGRDDTSGGTTRRAGGPAGKSPSSTGGFVYRGHGAAVSCAKFSPSGTYVASGDARGRLRVWSYDHDEHLPRLDVQALPGTIRDVSWDHEGRRIVVVGDGGNGGGIECSKVVMWDTGVRCGDLSCHARRRGSTCAYRPCRPMRIVTGGAEDASLFLHSGPPFRRVTGDGIVGERCHERRGAVHRARYNRDGSVLASVGTDGSVCLYDGGTLAPIVRTARVHDSSVYSCAWDRSGGSLLTCGADGYARLVDGRDGRVVREWDVASSSTIVSGGERSWGGGGGRSSGAPVPAGAMQLGCAFVKGNVPVSAGFDGHIAILRPESSTGGDGSSPRVITGHQAPISAMTFGVPGGDTIYTSDTDGVIVEWDGTTGRARGRVAVVVVNDDHDDDDRGEDENAANNALAATRVHAGATVTSLVFVDDTGTLYSAGWDDRVRTTHGRACDGKLSVKAQPNAMSAGKSVVVVMTVGGLLVIEDRQVVSELIPLPYAATSVCLARDDSTLYVGGDDCNIHVYNLCPRNPVNPLQEVHVIKGGHLHPVRSMALSPDNSMLAAADVRDVCVYTTDDSCGSDRYSTVVPKGRWCYHTQRIGCLAWSPDGTVIASGGNDDSIFLWCPAQKTKRVHYRFAHRGGVTGLRFVGRNCASSSSSCGGKWTLVSAGADGCLNWWNVEKDVKEKFGL